MRIAFNSVAVKLKHPGLHANQEKNIRFPYIKSTIHIFQICHNQQRKYETLLQLSHPKEIDHKHLMNFILANILIRKY